MCKYACMCVMWVGVRIVTGSVHVCAREQCVCVYVCMYVCVCNVGYYCIIADNVSLGYLGLQAISDSLRAAFIVL